MTKRRQTVPRKSSRSPTEVDKQVGRNVRRYRKDMHMTLNDRLSIDRCTATYVLSIDRCTATYV